ncbi:MAG: hypothetical protein LBS69_03145 [Prevotellaceae bacterium]|jgi:hypothetical protein|nr:hypothetical protein [Prevotellaceae bacterium]
MRVLFLPEVRYYFKELAEILYKNDYFGFEETAIQYAEDLFNNIANTLPIRVKKIAPSHFDRYGKDMFYAVFPKNKQTQWYVFFNIYANNGEKVYLVRYISNNHVTAQLL